MEIASEKHRTGGCQCGAVRYELDAIYDNSHVCHCRMCQRAVGNFFAPLVGVPNDRLRWHGTPAVFESSENIERGFCRDCGTPLFYRHAKGTRTSILIATLDDYADVPLNYEFGFEGRAGQLDALGHVEHYRTEDLMAEEAAKIAQSSRQFRP